MIGRKGCGVGRGLFDLLLHSIGMLVPPFRISAIDHRKLVDSYTGISTTRYNLCCQSAHLSVVRSREGATVAL